MIIPNIYIYIYMEKQKMFQTTNQMVIPSMSGSIMEAEAIGAAPEPRTLTGSVGATEAGTGTVSAAWTGLIRCFIMFRTPDAPDSSGFVH